MNANFQRNRTQGFVLFKMDFRLEFKIGRQNRTTFAYANLKEIQSYEV